MCNDAERCDVCKELKKRHRDSLVKYWGVISGMCALIITMILFYANTTHATAQVHEHESRIRNLETATVETSAVLKEIKEHVVRTENKIDTYIYKRGN
jgi:hypothetical protein